MSGRRVVLTTSWKTCLFSQVNFHVQPVVPPRIDDPILRFCNVGCAVCDLLVLPDLTKGNMPVLGVVNMFLLPLLL